MKVNYVQIYDEIGRWKYKNVRIPYTEMPDCNLTIAEESGTSTWIDNISKLLSRMQSYDQRNPESQPGSAIEFLNFSSTPIRSRASRARSTPSNFRVSPASPLFSSLPLLCPFSLHVQDNMIDLVEASHVKHPKVSDTNHFTEKRTVCGFQDANHHGNHSIVVSHVDQLL